MFGRVFRKLLNRFGTKQGPCADEVHANAPQLREADNRASKLGAATSKASFLRNLAIGGPVLLLVALAPFQAGTFEIPTTPSGSWTASGVTNGQVPFGFDAGGNPLTTSADSGTYFKTTPSGLRMSVTVNGTFPIGTSGSYFATPPQTNTTGLNPSAAGTNPGVFTTTPTMPGSTNPLNLFTAFNPCVATFPASTTCTGLGTVRVALTDPLGGAVPVAAPKIHVTRIGGTATGGGPPATTMELGTGLQINAGGSSAGISFSSTASTGPTLNVSATEFFGDPNAAGQTLNVNCGVNATTTSGCGTVQVNGNLATLLLNVKAYRTTLGPNSWAQNADGYFFDMSFDEDFGGAPTTYEGGGTAAGHIITDLRLGSAVSVDNPTTANGGATGAGLVTASPNAVVAPAAAGDTNDGATFPALTTANIGASLHRHANIQRREPRGRNLRLDRF